MTTPEDRLRKAGLELPVPHSPVGSYRMARFVGNTLWVSGHGAFEDGVPVHVGKLGDSLTAAQGALAARDVMLQLLGTVKAQLGDLSAVAPAKVVVLVNSTPDFAEHHVVANGATDLLLKVFGEEHGRPARTAMGVAALPFSFAVEIEAVFEVADPRRVGADSLATTGLQIPS